MDDRPAKRSKDGNVDDGNVVSNIILILFYNELIIIIYLYLFIFYYRLS